MQKFYLVTLLSLALVRCVTPAPFSRKTAESYPKALILISLDGVGYQQLQKIDPDFLSEFGAKKIRLPNPSLEEPTRHEVFHPKVPPGSIENISAHIQTQLKAWDRTEDFFVAASSPGLDESSRTYGPYSAQARSEWNKIKTQLDDLKNQLKKMDLSRVQLTLLFVSNQGINEGVAWTFPASDSMPADAAEITNFVKDYFNW